MAKTENEIIDDLMDIINGYHGKDYFIMGQIPQKKLAASTAFHGVDPRDTVLVLLDSTIMGTAENGMSITLKGIYWKNMWAVKTRKNHYTWAELADIAGQMEVKGGHILFEPGVEFYVPANYKEASLLNLLKTLSNYYKEVMLASADTGHLSAVQPASSNPVNSVPMLEDGSTNSDFQLTLANSLALAICHAGSPSEPCLEVAMEFIHSEEDIDKACTLDQLSTTIDLLQQDFNKSSAFFKIRQSKTIATLKKLTSHQVEQLSIMLDALSEAIEPENLPKYTELRSKILGAIN